MGERENREAGYDTASRETAATARSLSVVHYMERDQDDAARLVAGLLDRSAAAEGNPSLLAVLPNPDDALTLSEAVRKHRGQHGPALTPITSVIRGRRLLGANATAVAGSPSHLMKLISESRLAIANLHTVVVLWPEETLADEEQRAALESLVSEVPRTVERVAICSTRSAELTAFLERTMWRARTVDHVVPVVPGAGGALRVMTAAPADRARALRNLLDAFDPESAVLITFSDASESAAREAAAIFGSDADMIQVSRGIPERRFNLAVIFDDVPTAESLAAATAVTDELVAIVRPTRLGALQKVAVGATPLTWTGALANARSAHDALRDELRGTALSGSHLPWVPIIEPILAEVDAVEVAAAALLMLDRERRRARKAAAVTTAPAPAPTVADRPVREARPRPTGEKPFARREDPRRERGRDDRGFAKKPGGWAGSRKRDDDTRRGAPRDRGGSDRPRRDVRPGSDRPRRDDRPGSDRPRGDDRPGGRAGSRFRDDSREKRGSRDDIERVPRAAHEGREWSERGERLKHSRRGPRGGENA